MRPRKTLSEQDASQLCAVSKLKPILDLRDTRHGAENCPHTVDHDGSDVSSLHGFCLSKLIVDFRDTRHAPGHTKRN
ncbi:hypothetical protein BaRGS_00030651, partial [Batillaria attramentaria]